jgi:hypothetical protein
VLAIDGPVLGLVWLDGWMEGIRSVLDLEAVGIARLGDFFDCAEDFLLPDETEGAVL